MDGEDFGLSGSYGGMGDEDLGLTSSFYGADDGRDDDMRDDHDEFAYDVHDVDDNRGPPRDDSRDRGLNDYRPEDAGLNSSASARGGFRQKGAGNRGDRGKGKGKGKGKGGINNIDDVAKIADAYSTLQKFGPQGDMLLKMVQSGGSNNTNMLANMMKSMLGQKNQGGSSDNFLGARDSPRGRDAAGFLGARDGGWG